MKNNYDSNADKFPINKTNGLNVSIVPKESVNNHQSNKDHVKPKPINKCDLGPDFVPPDGGFYSDFTIKHEF